MSVLTEIKTKLDTLGTLGTLFIGSMPSTTDVCGVLKEYGGSPAERQFGIVGIKYENPSIQISFRGVPFDYASPRAKAEIAWRYLMTIQPGALGAGITTEYLTLDAQQSPFPTEPQDTNNRWYIGFNVYVKKVPS